MVVDNRWSAAAMRWRTVFFYGLFKRCVDSSSSLHTSFACWGGVKSSRLQCCGNKSKDAVVLYAIVSGT